VTRRPRLLARINAARAAAVRTEYHDRDQDTGRWSCYQTDAELTDAELLSRMRSALAAEVVLTLPKP